MKLEALSIINKGWSPQYALYCHLQRQFYGHFDPGHYAITESGCGLLQESRDQDRIDQAIKQASRNEPNDQALILAINIFDQCRSWKYRTHIYM
jgi:hypothetical protein